jgi:hypothetical protein
VSREYRGKSASRKEYFARWLLFRANTRNFSFGMQKIFELLAQNQKRGTVV